MMCQIPVGCPYRAPTGSAPGSAAGGEGARKRPRVEPCAWTGSYADLLGRCASDSGRERRVLSEPRRP